MDTEKVVMVDDWKVTIDENEITYIDSVNVALCDRDFVAYIEAELRKKNQQ